MGISLLTMGAGNVKILHETLKSAATICDEIIYGDLLLFDEDRQLLESYKKEFNLKIVKYPFNFIFKNGFASILNDLANHSSNNLTLYLNTSEIIEEDYGTLDIIKHNPDCNTFYFINKTDPHRWFRLGDKRYLKWSGLIHEQYQGEYKPYHRPVFCMKDLPKDMDDPFKSIVLDCLKECVYFENYIRIADNPDQLGETDAGWYQFAKKDYDSFKKRLEERGEMYNALKNENWKDFTNACYNLKTNIKFNSSLAIEYQNNEKFLGK